MTATSSGRVADGFRLFAARLLGVYVSPSGAFRSIQRNTSFWWPVCGIVLLMASFMAIWSSQVDPAQFVRARIDESPRAAQLSSEQRDEITVAAAQALLVKSWTTTLIVAVVWVLAGGLYFYVVFAGLCGADLGLGQAVAVSAYVSLAVGIARLSLTCLVLAIRGDWTISPESALQANLALLLEPGTVGRGVHSLASSVDLFSLWSITLRSIGYGVVTARKPAVASVAVLAPWLTYALVKAALAQ
jgi:hypothetical protein